MCKLIQICAFSSLCALSSCTLSVNVIHTQGSATDVVDEDQNASPTVSPDINLDMPGAFG